MRPSDAVALIERARQARIPVLGVDAFILSNEATQPMMEHSADFTSRRKDSAVDSWTAAAEFLRAYRSTDFYFEVVLG